MLELLSIIINVIAPILLVMGVGFLIGKRFNPDPATLSVYLIYLFTPSLVFSGIYTTELASSELLGLAGVVIGVAFCTTGIGFLAARFLKYDARGESALLLSVLIVNAANYGISLNKFAFGDAGGSIAIIYYVVNSIMANVVGVYFASRGSFSVKDAILNIFKVPILYAALLGLLLNLMDIELPLILRRSIIEIAANASIPLMLALLGLQLSRISFRPEENGEKTLATNWLAVGLATSIRLLIAPVIGFALAWLFGLRDLTFKVAVVQSAMPTAVLASALATQFGGDARYVSMITMVATLTSVISLSILLLILGGVSA
jgi:malate permease and related proteins